MNIEKLLIKAGNENNPSLESKNKVYGSIQKKIERNKALKKKQERISVLSWKLAYMIFPLIFVGIILLVSVPMFNKQSRNILTQTEETPLEAGSKETKMINGFDKREPVSYLTSEISDNEILDAEENFVIEEENVEKDPNGNRGLLIGVFSIVAAIIVYSGWVYSRRSN